MQWKRWTIAVLTLSLLLALAACGPAQDATDPTGEDSTTNQTGETTSPEDTQTTQENQENQNGQDGQNGEAAADTVSVPESAPVDAGWFDDAAFVGDSVSVTLANYNSSYGTLGKAKFFCSVSLRPATNACPNTPPGPGSTPASRTASPPPGPKKFI